MSHSKIDLLKALNPLFDYITKNKEDVFWMRSLDLTQQLYLSDSFEKVWGLSKDILFTKPLSFASTILSEDLNAYYKETLWRTQVIVADPISSIFFRIKSPNGELKYIYDFSFILFDDNKKPVARAGLGCLMTSEEWYCKREQPLQIKEFFSTIPNLNAFKSTDRLTTSYTIYTEKQTYYLKNREAECLFYLLKGYSGKKIAHAMNISIRTVETHFYNLRKKIGVSSLIELIASIKNIEEIPKWQF